MLEAYLLSPSTLKNVTPSLLMMVNSHSSTKPKQMCVLAQLGRTYTKRKWVLTFQYYSICQKQIPGQRANYALGQKRCLHTISNEFTDLKNSLKNNVLVVAELHSVTNEIQQLFHHNKKSIRNFSIAFETTYIWTIIK